MQTVWTKLLVVLWLVILPMPMQGAETQTKPVNPAAKTDDSSEPWVFYPGKNGPGSGKSVVLISGDEEYRSEEALSQLGKILAEQHGFDCTVLFAIDPESGQINPLISNNIPGTEKLDDADVLVVMTRFRALPDEQMQHVDRYLKAGKPVLGLRTATHAFKFPKGSPWVHYGNGYKGSEADWTGGFGKVVLGEQWVAHHGKHKEQSTRGVIAEDNKSHPVLRGINDREIWGATDVYAVNSPISGNAEVLLLGEVVNRAGPFLPQDVDYGMRSDDPAAENQTRPLMPIVWTRTYQLPDGQPGSAITCTMGSASDLMNAPLRKLLVNSVYQLAGLTEKIPADGAQADLVEPYEPSQFGFLKNEDWQKRKATVDQFRLK